MKESGGRIIKCGCWAAEDTDALPKRDAIMRHQHLIELLKQYPETSAWSGSSEVDNDPKPFGHKWGYKWQQSQCSGVTIVKLYYLSHQIINETFIKPHSVINMLSFRIGDNISKLDWRNKCKLLYFIGVEIFYYFVMQKKELSHGTRAVG